jgi:hypothetical protein
MMPDGFFNDPFTPGQFGQGIRKFDLLDLLSI